MPENQSILIVLTAEGRQELTKEIAAAVVAALHDSPQQLTPASTAPASDEWGSRDDACAILKCSKPTLHAMINEGLIQRRKVGRRTLCNLTELRVKLEAGQLARYQRRK